MSGSTVHPLVREVPVNGGAAKVKVEPWKMGNRAALKPRLADLLGKLTEFQGRPQDMDLKMLFDVAEEEVCEIVRATVQLPDDLKWDDIRWEDLPTMAQAVWEVCVVREDGGGIAGKIAGALGAAFNEARLRQMKQTAAS